MSRVLKLVFGGLLFAQSVAAQPGAGAPTPPPVGTGAPTEADIGVRQRAPLNPQDMLNQSREYRQRVADVIKRVEGQVEQAQKQKDVIRINCLQDKLVQARANLNVMDQAIVGLQDSLQRRDEGQSIHEYTRITIVQQKVQVLATEADQCVGEDLSFVGATRVDVDVDPGVRPDDPTNPDLEPPPVDRPPAASPYM
jgi:hypothetical protein